MSTASIGGACKQGKLLLPCPTALSVKLGFPHSHRWIPRVGSLGWKVGVCLCSWESATLLSRAVAPFCPHTWNLWDSKPFLSLSELGNRFNFSCLDRRVVASCCGFECLSLTADNIEHFLSWLLPIHLLWWYQIFTHIVIELFSYFKLWEFFIYFEWKSLLRCVIYKDFFPSVFGLSFKVPWQSLLKSRSWWSLIYQFLSFNDCYVWCCI